MNNPNRIEILRTLLITGLEVNYNYLEDNDINEIIKLSKYTKNILWNNEVLNRVLNTSLNSVNKMEGLEFIETLLNNSGKINCKLVADHIFSLIKDRKIDIENSKEMQTFFNCIAFASLFLETQSQLQELWNSEQIISFKVECREWLKYKGLIDVNRINNTQLILFIIAVLRGQNLSGKKVSENEKEYCLYLLIYLTQNDSKFFNDNAELKEIALDIAEKNKLEFLKWTINSASYYPDSNVAIKNIEINNRMIMINNETNELLVRGNKEIFEDTENIIKEEWDTEDIYYKIYKISSYLEDFDSKIKKKNGLKEIIQFSNSIFGSFHNESTVNVFEQGTFCNDDDNVYLKYSKHDKKIIAKFSESNSIDEYEKKDEIVIEKMLERIKTVKGNEKIFKDTYIDFTFSDLDKYFFPKYKHVKKEKFIPLFFSNCQKSPKDLNIYELEAIKIETLYKYYENHLKIGYKNNSIEFETLDLYNKFYSPLSEDLFVGYKKIVVMNSNLEETYKSFREILLGNIESKIFKDIIEEIESMKNKLIEELKKLISENYRFSDFKKVEIKFDSRYKQLEINGNKKMYKEIKVLELGENIEKSEEITDKIEQDWDSISGYYHNDILIYIPKTIIKVFEIVEHKTNKYDKDYQKNLNNIKNIPLFRDAVQVIKEQNDINNEESENKLINFLKDIESKYHLSIISVISSYRTIKETEIQSFIEILKSKLDNPKTLVIPLKNYRADMNGLYEIIEKKFEKDFNRSKEYFEKLDKSITRFLRATENEVFDEIVIVSDLGKSASQFTTSFNRYYLQKDKKTLKNEYYECCPIVYESLLKKAKKITLLNCLYTDYYEENVKEWFSSHFKDEKIKEKINFEGTKENKNNYLFYNKIEYANAIKFKEFIENIRPDLLNIKLCGDTYENYLTHCLTTQTKVDTLLIARFKCMPKKRHILFDEAIFSVKGEHK